MTVRPKVSVIVPVHGTARSLRQCLDSLAGQSLRDIEIIAVDDASPDGAGGIIDEYARRDPRVRSSGNFQKDGWRLSHARTAVPPLR